MKALELPTRIYFTILDMGSGYVYTPSLDDNGGTEYIRKDLVEHIIRGALGPQDALNKIRSL